MPRPHYLSKRHLKALTLRNLIEEFRRDPIASSTIERWHRAIAKFETLAGSEPCSSISRWSVDRVCEALLEQSSPTSVRNTLLSLADLVRRGQRCGLLPATPNPFLMTLRARGLRPPQPVDLSLSPEVLRQVFANKPYDRPLDGGPTAAWLPLVTLFTGARVTELLRTRPHDVVYHDGVHALRLTRPPVHQWRGTQQHRFVPLPEALLGCGLLPFIEKRRSDGNHWLFAEGLNVTTEAARVRGWVARNLRTATGHVTIQALRRTYLAAPMRHDELLRSLVARTSGAPWSVRVAPRHLNLFQEYGRPVIDATTPCFSELDLSHVVRRST